MPNIWRSIRTSLVQKVTDLRKRRSETPAQQQHQPVAAEEEQVNVSLDTTANQTTVN